NHRMPGRVRYLISQQVPVSEMSQEVRDGISARRSEEVLFRQSPAAQRDNRRKAQKQAGGRVGVLDKGDGCLRVHWSPKLFCVVLRAGPVAVEAEVLSQRCLDRNLPKGASL